MADPTISYGGCSAVGASIFSARWSGSDLRALNAQLLAREGCGAYRLSLRQNLRFCHLPHQREAFGVRCSTKAIVGAVSPRPTRRCIAGRRAVIDCHYSLSWRCSAVGASIARPQGCGAASRAGASPAPTSSYAGAVRTARDGMPVPYEFLCGCGARRRASNARPYTMAHINGGSKPPPLRGSASSIGGSKPPPLRGSASSIGGSKPPPYAAVRPASAGDS